jgi:hypothetical protein
MNEPKFTPGPWNVIDCAGLEVEADGISLCALWHSHDEEQEKANARLIAAAPCLLAALQACDEAMEYMSEYDIPITLPGQVKAAIKKATGEPKNETI